MVYTKNSSMNIILSPHLDDAVFNIWHILNQKNTQLITVFAGLPNGNHATLWDRVGGFKKSRDMMEARRQENETALRGLGVTIVNLDFLDNQYMNEARDEDELYNQLKARVAKSDTIYAPIAASKLYRHPDHVLLRDIGLQLKKEGFQVSFYADIPYMQIPQKPGNAYIDRLERRIFSLTAEKLKVSVISLDKKEVRKKVAAMKAYETQFTITNITSFGGLSKKANIQSEIEIK
jgi:LmbE family N-acetylglucosaminyl deacetylase